MRSLKSILDADNSINLQNLQALVSSIPAYFRDKKKLPKNAINLVLVEMLPDEDLESISKKIGAELKSQSAKTMSEDAGAALAALAAAVHQKLAIKTGNGKSLDDQKKELVKQELKTHSSKISHSKINALQEIIDVAKKIEGDSIDSNIRDLQLNVRMLNDIFSQSPSYINNFFLENNRMLESFLRDFNLHYSELVDAQHAFADENHLLDLYIQCLGESDALISGICSAIGVKIQEQGSRLSSGAHNKMTSAYNNLLTQFDALIKAESQASLYEETEGKFQQLLGSLQTLFKELPDSK